MDCVRRFLRPRVWFYLLLCVLSVDSFAATRKYVNLPSNSSAVGNASATSKSGGTLSVTGQPMEGEYIPSSYSGSKGTKLPAKARYDYSIPRTLKGMNGTLGAGVAGVALSYGLQWMLDQVGGFIDEQGRAMKDGPQSVGGVPVGGSGAYDPSQLCNRVAKSETFGKVTIITSSGITYAVGVYNNPQSNVPPYPPADYNAAKANNSCTNSALGYKPVNGYFPISRGKIISIDQIEEGAPIPLTQADYDLMESFAAVKDSDWLKARLREHCEGSLKPDACYQSLRDSVSITGPSSVPGPSTTSTTTYTKPDGTTGTATTTTNTTYNINYGPTYYDYSRTTQTTKSEDGVPVSEETTTEDEQVTEEEPADSPAPCSGECDGPAYADQYTPTDQTKEGAIDDYMTRVRNAPIIAAGAGFLSVSVGGSCPVWEAHENLQLNGESMPIDLVFDFHCRPWFTDFQPYAAIIMLTVCTFFAFRIAMLD